MNLPAQALRAHIAHTLSFYDPVCVDASGGFLHFYRDDGRAYAHAAMAGERQALAWIEETWDLMEARFWSAEFGLYADVASADWTRLDPYRGHLSEWAKLLLTLERHPALLAEVGDCLLPRAQAESPAGKTDDHTMGACYEMIAALERLE